MEEKLRELAAKHQIPEPLLLEAIQEEKKKIVLQNRKMVPILMNMIERYASSIDASIEERDRGA